MKVCVISFSNLKLTPYAAIYTNIFDSENIDYNIVCFDRMDSDEPLTSNTYCFSSNIIDKSRVSKILPFWRYRKYIIDHLENVQYDFLIILSPILAVLLTKLLKQKYSGSFLVDIRDFTYENSRNNFLEGVGGVLYPPKLSSFGF